jgi:Xaa-Pro aminopeptidase
MDLLAALRAPSRSAFARPAADLGRRFVKLQALEQDARDMIPLPFALCEHQARLKAIRDRTILRSGNVLHSILGMWMDGWGIEVSETILVTPAGNETLTKFQRDIHVKS